MSNIDQCKRVMGIPFFEEFNKFFPVYYTLKDITYSQGTVFLPGLMDIGYELLVKNINSIMSLMLDFMEGFDLLGCDCFSNELYNAMLRMKKDYNAFKSY